jgi:hypothetical protein
MSKRRCSQRENATPSRMRGTCGLVYGFHAPTIGRVENTVEMENLAGSAAPVLPG